jgi:hypothetical protein
MPWVVFNVNTPIRSEVIREDIHVDMMLSLNLPSFLVRKVG